MSQASPPSSSQWRQLIQRLKTLNVKPQVIKELQDWTSNTQNTIRQAKAVGTEIKKVVSLSKEPKELTKYLLGILQTVTEDFRKHTNRYVKIGLIVFVAYRFFSVLSFLARFSNVELVKYCVRYLRLIYFGNYFGYFLKHWLKKPSIVDSVRSIIVLFIILFIENIITEVYKLWMRIGQSPDISQWAKIAYKITILILTYIYLKEAKNQVYNLAIFNGEIVDQLIVITNSSS